MSLKILGIFSLILFIVSVGFSFYFSQEIVHLNQSFQNFEIEQSTLNQQLESLQIELLKLSQLKPQDNTSYVPINESVKN